MAQEVSILNAISVAVTHRRSVSDNIGLLDGISKASIIAKYLTSDVGMTDYVDYSVLGAQLFERYISDILGVSDPSGTVRSMVIYRLARTKRT